MAYDHIVPQVYLKRWTFNPGKTSLYKLDKQTGQYYQRSKDKVGGKRSAYHLKLFVDLTDEDFDFVNYYIEQYYELFPNCFTEIEGFLSNYTFELDGKNITNSKEKLLIIKTAIISKDSNLVKRNYIIDQVSKLWASSEAYDFIEKALHDVEDEWEENSNNILAQLTLTNSCAIDLQNHDQIAKFISIQCLRNSEERTQKKAIAETFKIVNELVEPLNMNFVPTNDMYYSAWLLNTIKSFLGIKNSENKNTLSSIENAFYNNCFFYMRAVGTKKFITCDNPVVAERINQKGLFVFPISPSVCVLVCSYPEARNDFKLKATDIIVDYYNSLIYENAIKEAYSIDKSFTYKKRSIPKTEIRKMWNDVGLEYWGDLKINQ